MSRIGNAIIELTKDVTVTQEGDLLVVKGAKGEIRLPVPAGLKVTVENNIIQVTRLHNDKASKSLHGYLRAVLANAVIGVTKGWTRVLELSGVGYRATMSGANVVLSVGFSHQVTMSPPQGVTFTVVENKINVTGIDRQVVGQTAAKIRAVKKPEPYKGKGIRYLNEVVTRKAGKTAATGAGKAGK